MNEKGDERAPFGISSTKRHVSLSGEEELFRPYEINGHGEIELVDYMGGDDVVERVATMGYGIGIFPENLSQREFIHYLVHHGICEPFRSVQLKFSFQCPIETALTFVYEPSVNVNEYSGRYSVMPKSSLTPSIEKIAQMLDGEPKEVSERAREIHTLLARGRRSAYATYEQLIEIDMAKELARSGLGTDNDTRFYWKMDLLSLANFVQRQQKLLGRDSHSMAYVKKVSEIAQAVAPEAWVALNTGYAFTRYIEEITMPTDDEVVDGSLSPRGWEPSETRRVVVPELEKILFERRTLLDHGEFQVTDYMGNDSAFAQAARTSYGIGTNQN